MLLVVRMIHPNCAFQPMPFQSFGVHFASEMNNKTNFKTRIQAYCQRSHLRRALIQLL